MERIFLAIAVVPAVLGGGMAPKYVLHYFNLRARGEPIRWIFHYAGQEFEDRRVEFDQWAAIKPTTPFGTLPYLEVDGKPMGGSMPIARFLARKFGLAGGSAWDEAEADSIVDYVDDAEQNYVSWTGAFLANDTKNADLIKEKYSKEDVIPYLQGLERRLQKNGNGNGFIVGNNVTWADFVLVAFLDKIKLLSEKVLDAYPWLKSHSDRVHDLKGIREWIAARPNTVL